MTSIEVDFQQVAAGQVRQETDCTIFPSKWPRLIYNIPGLIRHDEYP